MRMPVKVVGTCSLAIVLAVFSVPAVIGSAQTQAQTPPPQERIPGMPANSPEDPQLHHMTEQMAIKRNAQRQQQIVDDTAHLLQLAQQLNDDVSKTNKDTLSLDVVKDADQIEKLAKSIKDRMREAN